MTRTVRTLLLLATFGLLLTGVLAGAFAQIPSGSVAQADAPPAIAEPTPAPVEVLAPSVSGVDAEFIVALVGPATDLAPEHSLELVYAGHRVCEGFTAGVPMVDLADSLVAAHGFTDEEARAFITLADEFYCSAAV